MSLTAIRWAWDQDIAASVKYVLLALADYADEEGVCFPSQKTLARKCGLSRSTVNSHLQNLMRLGLITIQHRSSQRGYRCASLYRLLLTQSPKIQRRNFDNQSLKFRHSYVRNPDSIITNQLTNHRNPSCPKFGLRENNSNSFTKPALKDAL